MLNEQLAARVSITLACLCGVCLQGVPDVYLQQQACLQWFLSSTVILISCQCHLFTVMLFTGTSAVKVTQGP